MYKEHRKTPPSFDDLWFNTEEVGKNQSSVNISGESSGVVSLIFSLFPNRAQARGEMLLGHAIACEIASLM